MNEYTLKRSRRARQMRLAVHAGGTVVVTVPERFPEAAVRRFLERHAHWIERSVAKMRNRTALPVRGRRAYLEHKEYARRIVAARVRHWAAILALTHGRIAIKDTSSVWGSCSRKGNLNFSYKLIFLPPELLDYVVVHELCHLVHPNHSPAFWRSVARVFPQYRKLRTELAKYLLR